APRVDHIHHISPLPGSLIPCAGACSGEGGVKQESDTRARRQHSTVPVDRRWCPPPQAKSRAHRQHSCTGVDRNTSPASTRPIGRHNKHQPPTRPAHGSKFSSPTAERSAPGQLRPEKVGALIRGLAVLNREDGLKPLLRKGLRPSCFVL